MNRTYLHCALLFAVGLSCGAFRNSAFAHSDVFLAAMGSQVAVGGANELGTIDEHFDLTTRVFEGVMVSGFPPFDPADYGRDEPGFDALASGSTAFPAGATALPADSAVTINTLPFAIGTLVDSLFFWDGSGSVDFQPISTAQPGVAMTLDPNPIGTTSANGELHEHPVFAIDDGGASLPADGVYLIAPAASLPGLTDSQRFYMVWLVDGLLSDEEPAEGLEEALEQGETVYLGKDFAFFEEAVEYVQTQIVPEPASGALGLFAFTAILAALRPPRRVESGR
jgi:hypothetical protein